MPKVPFPRVVWNAGALGEMGSAALVVPTVRAATKGESMAWGDTARAVSCCCHTNAVDTHCLDGVG